MLFQRRTHSAKRDNSRRLPAGLRALDADGVYNRSVRRYTTGAKTVRLQYSGESRQATL